MLSFLRVIMIEFVLELSNRSKRLLYFVKYNKRRDFIKTGSLAGITTLVAASCTSGSLNGKSSGEAEGNVADNFELNEVTIDTLQKKMQST